jgi:hypothetical protein
MTRKVSAQVAERYAADTELGAAYRQRLDAAESAERELRRAQAAGLPHSEVRDLAFAFDRALLSALGAADAARRAAMGTRAYVDPDADAGARRRAEIAARKARARADVRPWVAEVDRLRTLRERHRLTFRLQGVV